MILLRPLCWLPGVGHLWEEFGEWPEPVYWLCGRCDLETDVQPKGW